MIIVKFIFNCGNVKHRYAFWLVTLSGQIPILTNSLNAHIFVLLFYRLFHLVRENIAIRFVCAMVSFTAVAEIWLPDIHTTNVLENM